MWKEALSELFTIMSINTIPIFVAQTRFKGEPDSTDLCQAAGLVGIAKFSVNLSKCKCSEVAVVNTMYIFGRGTRCIQSHCTCLQFNFLITQDGPTACAVPMGQGVDQKAYK